MTVRTAASQIQVRNADGSVKFTSDNRLVFLKAYQQGSVSIGSGSVGVFFQACGPNDFLVISIIINSSSGNAAGNASVVGLEIPANGSIMIDFEGRAVNNTAAGDCEYLGVRLINNSLVFKQIRYAYDGKILNGTKVTNLTYKARLYSWL